MLLFIVLAEREQDRSSLGPEEELVRSCLNAGRRAASVAFVFPVGRSGPFEGQALVRSVDLDRNRLLLHLFLHPFSLYFEW